MSDERDFQELEVLSSLQGPGEYVIRTGEALPVYPPKEYAFVGQIMTPSIFYDRRKGLFLDEAGTQPYFKHSELIVEVRRSACSITLLHKPNTAFADIIRGVLRQSDEYEKLGINSGKKISPAELGEKLRKNRFLLAGSATETLQLIADLKNFKGTVVNAQESTSDTRGQKRNLIDQSVSSNVPLRFRAHIPVFKGQKPEAFDIDIVLDVQNGIVVCELESIELLEKMEGMKNDLIDTAIDIFHADGITVLEE